MEEIRTLFVCQCGDPSHQLMLSYIDDGADTCVLCEVLLNPDFSFFRRLLCAMRYVFCRKIGRYGNVAEVLLTSQHYRDLHTVVEHLRPKAS